MAVELESSKIIHHIHQIKSIETQSVYADSFQEAQNVILLNLLHMTSSLGTAAIPIDLFDGDEPEIQPEAIAETGRLRYFRPHKKHEREEDWEANEWRAYQHQMQDYES